MFPLSDQQRLFLVESEQVYRAWETAVRQHEQYRYGMRWLKSNGREYLIRVADARGNGRSLGPRTPETESTRNAFDAGKIRSHERLKGLSARLREQAKLNRAIGLGRLPTVIGDILGRLNVAGAGQDFRVIGTHAIFGYEAIAGVHCRMELLASGDVDLLYDSRKRLSLVSRRLDGSGLLGLLRKADKSFEPAGKGSFRAINADGFMVDLISQPIDMRQKDAVTFAQEDLVTTEVPSLEWLANSPRIEAVAISANGLPVLMSLCDPRAFAMHKAWLSRRPDRDPVKKQRDINQALLVAEMVLAHLPQYPFNSSAMKYLPADVLSGATRDIEQASDIRLPGMDF
ncbi:MAG: nucleotidyltransferase domain-containing protein [Betaproteobacteria bacterium]|nr:nucleotidyltransferase domain-containing protein [Betaproteobacteria bacterium]MCL2887112.1 nucleotidyltransferase domain-containing protein [Betaproteobacteria bacterium]